MKKVLFFTILIVCALFLFHACDDNEWGGSVVSNTKEISGPFEIEREYNLLSKNDLLVQAEVYYADTTEEITSVAVYRICEFWDGCDVQI
ncbi:hypothetical protein IT409_02715, partial [Candidatus Falkowbacteria bacterium]|nr:hypothetical protein [Candidatus Falkowbacteria bacterium]